MFSICFFSAEDIQLQQLEADIVPIDIVSGVACMVRASGHSGDGMQAKVKGDG